MNKQKIIVALAVALLFLTLQYLLTTAGQAASTMGAANNLIFQTALILFTFVLTYLAWKRRGSYRKWLIGFAALSVLTAFFFIGSTGVSSDRRLVGAYYYAWYHTSDWASYVHHETPILGAYDSSNTTVIRQHLAWAKDYGIDFYAISLWQKWQGPETDLYHQHYTYDTAQAIFKENLAMGNSIRLCVMIEPRTQQELTGLADKAWQLTVYSSYLQWYGKPLLLIYTAYIPSFAQFSDTRFTIKYVPLDLPYFTTQIQTTFIGDAVSVKPGANISYAMVDRENGLYYEKQWQFAVAWARVNPQRSLIAIITSFNEAYEATEIEPCVDWSNPFLYMELTKQYASQFKAT